MPSLHLLPSQGGKLPGIMLMLPFSVHGTYEGAYSFIACAHVSPIINIHSPPIAHQICIFTTPFSINSCPPFSSLKMSFLASGQMLCFPAHQTAWPPCRVQPFMGNTALLSKLILYICYIYKIISFPN